MSSQPSTCPLELFEVIPCEKTKTLTVKAKTRDPKAKTEIRQFRGSDRYREYQNLWQSLKTSLPHFESCQNPLEKDPQYQKAIKGLKTKPKQPQDVTVNDIDLDFELPPPRISDMVHDHGLQSWELDESNISTSIPTSIPTSTSTTSGGGFFTYLFRLAILFGLIFAFVTLVPKQPLELMTRLTIAGIVVMAYVLLDFIRRILVSLKDRFCKSSCGCN